ncbi:7161_t:CDS:2 [Entrophospora sp. SA101]|nr:7161_t:CDS:2 [Entrophospora sp. SA101]
MSPVGVSPHSRDYIMVSLKYINYGLTALIVDGACCEEFAIVANSWKFSKYFLG